MGQQLGRVRGEALESAKLGANFRSGRRVAVQQIETADEDAAHRRPDTPVMTVVRITGKPRRVSWGSALRAR
jgi:hypothetical protein